MKLILSEIDIEYKGGASSSPSGSLTPKNNKSKKGFSFSTDDKMEDDSVKGYLYTYSNEKLKAEIHPLVEIQHFSIDPAKVKNAVEEFNKKKCNSTSNQAQGSGAGKTQPKTVTGKTSKQEKVSYDKDEHLKAYKGKGDDVKELHKYEVALIAKAIETVGEDKVALVDIFARQPDGKIRLVEFKEIQSSPEIQEKKATGPETHTIILLKGSGATILVIDPNNSAFSSHIAFQYNDKYNGKLVAHTNPYKIYSSEVNSGRYINNSRDCIDIAIKLAYKLSKVEDDVDFKSGKAGSEIFTNKEANDAVKFISNSSQYDNTIDELVCNEQGFLMIPARLKQITQEGYGKEFFDNELSNMKIVSSKLNKLSSYTDSDIRHWGAAIEAIRDGFKGKQGKLKEGLGVQDYIKARKDASDGVSEIYEQHFPSQEGSTSTLGDQVFSLKSLLESLNITSVTVEVEPYTQSINSSGDLNSYYEYMS